MRAQVTRPWQPFGVALAALAIVTVAVFRLPDTLLTQIQSNGPFTSVQADWAYRLLALAAAAQAVFVGFVVLRIERVQSSIEKDPKLGEMSKDQIAASLGRAGAGMAMLTLLYGLSAMFIGGQRAGFWLFVVLTLIQLAWYYRQTGAISQWLEFQPEPTPHRIRDVWRKETTGLRSPPDPRPDGQRTEVSGLGGRTRSAPDRPAVICGDRSLSFGELEGLQARLAGFMSAASIGTGDRVALLAANSIDLLVVTVGCLRAGIVPVPISPLLTEPERAYLLEDSGARMLLTDRADPAPVERTVAGRARPDRRTKGGRARPDRRTKGGGLDRTAE